MSQAQSTIPQGAPVSQPAAAPNPAPMGNPDDGFIRVPREQLSQYNGDWHSVMQKANAHTELGGYATLAQQLREAGYGPEDVIAAMNAYEPDAQPSPQRFQPGAGSGGSGVTMEQLQQALQAQAQQFQQTVTQGLQTHTETQRRAAEQQQMFDQGHKRILTAQEQFLADLGYKLADEKGNPNPVAEMLANEFVNRLGSVMMERAPEGLKDEDRAAFFAGVNDDDVKSAAEKMGWAKDLKYDMAAQVASEQEDTPSATLGEGPSGKQQPKKFDDMTPEEQKEAVMSRVALTDD